MICTDRHLAAMIAVNGFAFHGFIRQHNGITDVVIHSVMGQAQLFFKWL